MLSVILHSDIAYFTNTTQTEDSMCEYRNKDIELIVMNASHTDSLVSVVLRLWNVQSWVQFSAGGREFLSQKH
jgi:hypothetical protein